MSQPFDQSIPVLTEVFGETGVARPAAVPVVAPVVVPLVAPLIMSTPDPAPVLPPDEQLIQDEPEPDAEAIGEQLAALATETWTEPEWKLLEQRVAGRILQQLDARIDATLDTHLRDSLADVLQFAMASLSTELRSSLQHAIETTVTRAVAQELEQIKAAHRQ